MPTSRSSKGLLLVENPSEIRILFMAPYAPDSPDYLCNPYTADGGYPRYHYELFRRLQKLGFRIESSSKPYAVVHAGGRVDYVFSLFNRMPIKNSELFVSSYCEYLGLPYLGAAPNIRAAAEDKYITKLLAKSLGIPVPVGVPYHRGVSPLEPAPFPGPYFVKNRFGAASEGITTENLQEEWSAAKRLIESFWDEGVDVLVEEYFDGIDLTVPVVGDSAPRVLGSYHPRSDKPGNVLTHDLKLTDHLGYAEVALDANWVTEDASNLCGALGPIDYLRLDYRYEPATGKRTLLEFNICCYIGKDGPFGLAAARDQITIDALLEHILAYSILRQGRRLNNSEGIL